MIDMIKRFKKDLPNLGMTKQLDVDITPISFVLLVYVSCSLYSYNCQI